MKRDIELIKRKIEKDYRKGEPFIVDQIVICNMYEQGVLTLEEYKELLKHLNAVYNVKKQTPEDALKEIREILITGICKMKLETDSVEYDNQIRLGCYERILKVVDSYFS